MKTVDIKFPHPTTEGREIRIRTYYNKHGRIVIIKGMVYPDHIVRILREYYNYDDMPTTWVRYEPEMADDDKFTFLGYEFDEDSRPYLERMDSIDWRNLFTAIYQDRDVKPLIGKEYRRGR